MIPDDINASSGISLSFELDSNANEMIREHFAKQRFLRNSIVFGITTLVRENLDIDSDASELTLKRVPLTTIADLIRTAGSE
jgi:hypothetical protein